MKNTNLIINVTDTNNPLTSKGMTTEGKLYYWEVANVEIKNLSINDIANVRMALYDDNIRVVDAKNFVQGENSVFCELSLRTEELLSSMSGISPNKSKSFTLYFWNDDEEEVVFVGKIPIYQNPYLTDDMIPNSIRNDYYNKEQINQRFADFEGSNSTSITRQGNTFNEPNKLVKLGSDGKIPEDLYNASGSMATALTVVLNGTPIVDGYYLVSYNNETKTVNIQHNLNCRVIAAVFNSDNKQVFIGVDYVDNNNVKIEFTTETFPSESFIYTVYMSTGGVSSGVLVTINIVDELPAEDNQVTGVLYLIPESPT